MKFTPFLALGLSLAPCVSALLTAKLIYEFPATPPKTLENLSVRPNGQLVLTVTSAPEIWTLDPSAGNSTPHLVYTFPNATGTAGIAQVSPDVYAVVTGIYNVTTLTGTQGSFSVWKLDLSKGTPSARKVTDIPQGQQLNGATVIKSSPGAILVADSTAGEIYHVNVNTGEYSVVQSGSYLESSTSIPIGINGLHVYANNLYFSNSAQGTFVRVPITATGGACGNYMVIAHDQPGEIYDDFAIDCYGSSWVTDHNNVVDKITISGQQSVAANQSNIVQPTSAAFGNGANSCTLYIVTAGTGGTDAPVHSGQIFSLQTC